jgi:hypothetical protein
MEKQILISGMVLLGVLAALELYRWHVVELVQVAAGSDTVAKLVRSGVAQRGRVGAAYPFPWESDPEGLALIITP